RNELPETVKRYKAYTDSFQEWLLQTAVNRNVECAAQLAEQAKKKKVKKPAKMSVEQQQRLVDAIAETKQPLTDTSGIRDLDDALRLRKEITYHHRINQTIDAGHTFYNSTLENAKVKLAGLITFIPVMLEAHDLDDEVSNRIFIHFPQHEPDQIDEETQRNSCEELKDFGLPTKGENVLLSSSEARSDEVPFTIHELRLKQEFLVLCFLYQYNRIRGVVRDTWMLYRDGSINIITAALVTDLAMDHIRQSVLALVEESTEVNDKYTLAEFIKSFYETISSGSIQPPLSGLSLRHLFCIDAIDQIDAYLAVKRPNQHNSSMVSNSNLPFMGFLNFYDVILKHKTKLPLWDSFTEDMLRHIDTAKDWLPFGFQVLIDVSEIVRNDYRKIYTHVTEHAMDLAKLMRQHIEYEDHMWAIGKKPDYMCTGDLKFSNFFIQPLDTLLVWIQELFKPRIAQDADATFSTNVFVTVHSTLAGLAMSYYNRIYHGLSISKTRWFLNCLCHLYNAAKQVGGLELAWPDLDYVIQMQGNQRIYTSEPPTKPNEFYHRFLLATGTSARSMAPDFISRGKFLPRSQMREKHGLAAHFPLEAKIRAYYGPDLKNERWLKRHAIFNHLHMLEENSAQPTTIEEQTVSDNLQQLQDTFSALINKVARPKSKAEKRNPSRLPVPEVPKMDDTYAPLLHRMRSELQAHELHSNFDYLSLYKRGFELALKIRSEVLFDANAQIVRRGNLDKDQTPGNLALIAELLRGLNINPKSGRSSKTQDEISTDVVPLDQLKSIAKIMKGLIQEEGSVELDRAKLRLNCQWDDLKASYDAEVE
ncbi:hypothetical protein GQ44DRAFT_589216, partial [Phaeosphaeriaceae sp. PMI808]